jgi:hypothetical protein
MNSHNFITVPTTDSGDDVEIPAAIWNGVGVVGLLSLLFWLLATGRLYTKSQHDEIVSSKDQVIETQAKTIDVKDGQLDKLSVVGETVVKILSSVDDLGRRRTK